MEILLTAYILWERRIFVLKRTGRVILIFFVVFVSMAGLWLFQGWQEMKRQATKNVCHNVYLIKAEGTTLYGIDGKEKTWQLMSEVDGITPGIADLILLDGKVTTIQKKPDILEGKILKIKEDNIQVESYGEVELDNYFRLYHVDSSGNVVAGTKEELLVGNSDIQYIVAGEKICAALVGETKLAKIRVLLTNGADKGYDYSEVCLSATSEYCVTQEGKTTTYPAGKEIVWKAGDVMSRIIVDTGNKGKIQLKNGKSKYGIPEYRGIFELEKSEKSIRIINEVNLEEYLYSVVPSEMPSEYPKEARKAQAICARTYAVQQMKGRRLAKYGAHVDDTVSFQVYNQLQEDANGIQAVQETTDCVVAKGGKEVSTYFYSVSCGCSEGTKDVWFTKKDEEYLPIQWQRENGGNGNIKEEGTFIQYIKAKGNSYDATSPWYRWQTTLTIDRFCENLKKKAKNRYESNPTQIQTKQTDGMYQSTGEVDIGSLQNLEIIERGKGGVTRVLEITGTKNTLRIYTEYNIRYLLGDEKGIYKQANQKEVTGLSLLPSGFFYIEKRKEGYSLYGGGYGHGVGMSQFGAKTMAKQGKNAQSILTFYFPGTSVVKRGEL